MKLKNATAKGLRQFSTFMRPELLQRLRLEAVRAGVPMQTIVTGALERALPQDIKITVGKTARSRRDDHDADHKSDDASAAN